MTMDMMAATVTRTAEGQTCRCLDTDFTFKVTAAETGGAYSMMEIVSGPQLGVPPHMNEQDETHMVAEGTYGFVLGDQQLVLNAGDLVFVPRGVAHGFQNIGETVGRILFIASPGGPGERFVEELAVGLAGKGIADAADPAVVQRIVEIGAKYGVTMAPPAAG
ncbi:MAG: cupin domain-containing protein [Anaerolineae bacterium]